MNPPSSPHPATDLPGSGDLDTDRRAPHDASADDGVADDAVGDDAVAAGYATVDPAAKDSVVEELVREYSAAVYRVARSVVRDAALADDVTQETFIKVWSNLDRFRGDGSMRSWILRIAHNTAVSTLRRIRDSATDPERMPDAEESIGTARVVEGRLAVDDLREALDDLDELTRSIIVLREVEGLSYEEIAQMVDVPIPTVKTRLLRGRRRLAVTLDAWSSAERPPIGEVAP